MSIERKAREAQILLQRRETLERRKRDRAARIARQAREHEAMRARLRGETDTASNMLAELRVAHLEDGHFVNGHFVAGKEGE